ncbi:interaptin-like [Linepithema humile]|uniref:interaptin-like n=1 Tax=Linepithema humile TaxID=83485 RepID=UPI00351ED886
MTDIYKKSILIALVLLVTVRPEEISTTRNTENTDLLNIRLSTNLPHLSLYNDEHFTKDNPQRSLPLLMPLSRDKYEKPKEASRKTKRCNSFRKDRFLSSTKENLTKARAKNLDKNNVEISKQNSNTHSFRNANYLQKNFITSDRERHKDEFLRGFKDNAEDKTINSEPKETTKKRNAEKCICYCKEKNCFPESSKKSSSQMLGSSGKNKPERINNRRREKYRNARPDISQQKSLRFFERPHETRIPDPINFYPIRSYQERVIPHVPVLYGIEAKPYVLSHMAGNDRKLVNKVPFISSHDRPNFLVGSNAYDQYQPIMYRNPYFISEKNQIADPVMSATLPSSSVDAATVVETESDPELYDSIEIAEKDQEPLYDYVDMSMENTETNFYPDYSIDVTTESNIVSFPNLDEMVHKPKDSTEIERNQDDNPSTTSSLTDYIDTISIPITYPSITDDKKFINMEECIKLFGRDVCVLSTSSINGIEKSNANSKDNFESANIESNANVNEGERIYESDDDDDRSTSLSSENTYIPIKKLMDQEILEFTETPRNRLLGKSKSHQLLLTLNDENTANPISEEKFPYSTIPSEFNSEGEVYNLKIDQQNLVTTTNTNLWQNILNKEESLEVKILQERLQEESATISHDSKIESNFEEENTSGSNESNDNAYLEQTILQEQPTEKIIIVDPNLETKYDFEETKNDFVKSQTNIYPEEEILQEPSTTLQYFDYENSNLNNEEATTDSLDSSAKKLPFCDNSLLLNTIKKVINDFALNAPLGKAKKLDKNILQTQGKSLLPEILQVSNLKNILSIPRIENTIVEKVKNILSDITAIPKRDFTNNWSHDIIRNTMRNILENFSDFHQKLPPMTVEEHQFTNGQWTVNPVTLASVLDSKVSMTNPQNLRECIRDLLSSPVIASQIDQQIIRNIIVQSIKNSLINDDEEEKLDNSIIHDALNDVLQALKNLKDTDESGKFVNNEDMTSSQETSTDDSEIGINGIDSILKNQQNLDINKDKKVDNKEMQTTTYQETKALGNNSNQLFAFTPLDLLKSSEEDKNIYIEEKTPNRIIDKIKEHIRDQISNGIKKLNMQNDEGIKLVEPLKTKTAYQKAISLNNPRILAISVEPDLAEELNKKENKKNILLQTATVSSITPTNFHETEEYIVNSTPRKDINMQNEEEIKNYPDTWNHLIIHHQPNSNLNFSISNSKEDSSRYDKIEPPITHGRNNNNKLPVNSYPSNDHIVDENVKVTASTDFMHKTLPDYAKMPDEIISKNIAEAKDVKDRIEQEINEKTLTTSANNLISFINEEYGNQESNTAATVSVDTVHPLIILERIRNKEPPIKYYSPEGLQYIRTDPANDENVKITTSIDFMQGASPDYVQISNGANLQNAAENKNIEREMEYTSNGKASLTSSDNIILPINAEYENCKSKIAPSADKDILESQQQDFATDDNIIKIHEVTTEVQRTYTKTTYFKPSTDDKSRITSSSLEYKITKSANNNDSMNKDSNLVDNYSTTAEGNGLIASSSSNNTYFLQLFPSSIMSDNISELQKSQLYYINDGVKLPLEIKKLQDDSYALLISRNICEQIMKKECPCCVPLQGHVIQELRKTHDQEDKDMTATEKHYQESTHMNDLKRNNQLADSSPSAIITSMTTNKNTLTMQSEEEDKSINRFQKRNLDYNDLTTISMPVIEFVKKYNLLLNEDKMLLDEIESDDKNKNCANLLIKSAKSGETKSHNFREERKSMQRIGSTSQEKNPIPKGVIINGEEIEMKSKKMDCDKLTDIDEEIKIYGKNNGRPYRYQRNTNSVTNPRAELVKSVLYWIKSLFVDE